MHNLALFKRMPVCNDRRYIHISSVPLSDVTHKTFYETWITLSDVKSGEIHVCCGWNTAIPANEDTQDLKNFYVVSVLVDKCHNLNGGKASSTSIQPKCKLKLEGGNCTEKFSTLPKPGTENPIFEEGFLFSCNEPQKEKLIIEVIDIKGIDSTLGFVKIPIDHLMASQNMEDIDKILPLEGGHPDARICISSKLYTLQ